MEEELLVEFKTQLEKNIRSVLSEEMKKSQNMSYSPKRLAILNAAATLGQNLKNSYSSFKSRFERIFKNWVISQIEYNLIIDNATNEILEEFIEGPNDQYAENVWQY
jgi:hypothetical protein